MKRDGLLLPALVVYAAASLLHHAHNAEFLDHYPNMPAWLSRPDVYAAWLGATAIGVLGYWLRHAVAPLPAHTPMMHLTIGLEAATAVALLAVLSRRRIE